MPLVYSGCPDIVADLQRVWQGSVPQDVSQMDEGRSLAEMAALVEGTVAGWAREARVGTAHGAFLELHARDQALYKQDGETDAALRARIATPVLAITPDLIVEALQQIVDANGGGTVYLEELPRDSLKFNTGRCWNRGWRWGSRRHVVIALVPASAHCAAACLDALRAKVSAGKAYMVQEYS